jgi:hypothetical protein
MANPASEKKASEIVDAFMGTTFSEEAEATAWLVKRIATALEQAEKAGQQAAQLSLRRDR